MVAVKLESFNSKLVRLKADTRTSAAVAQVRASNSKLVRIRSVRGAMNCATTSQEDKGFNSKLVRLEEWQIHPTVYRLHVSIPNWFD